MANLLLNGQPQVLPGVEIDTDYAGQNNGGVTLFVAVATDTPANSNDALLVGPREEVFFSRKAAENIYAWTSGSPGRIVWRKAA